MSRTLRCAITGLALALMLLDATGANAQANGSNSDNLLRGYEAGRRIFGGRQAEADERAARAAQLAMLQAQTEEIRARTQALLQARTQQREFDELMGIRASLRTRDVRPNSDVPRLVLPAPAEPPMAPMVLTALSPDAIARAASELRSATRASAGLPPVEPEPEPVVAAHNTTGPERTPHASSPARTTPPTTRPAPPKGSGSQHSRRK